MEKDSKHLRLLKFEKRLKKNNVYFTYGDDVNRKTILAISDSFSLLQQYSQDLYSVCTDNELFCHDKHIRKILRKAKNLKQLKKISFNYSIPDELASEYISQKYVVFEPTANCLKTIFETNEDYFTHYYALQLVFAVFIRSNGKPYIHFDVDYWFSIPKKWDIEIIFFILMKCDEVLSDYGFILE